MNPKAQEIKMTQDRMNTNHEVAMEQYATHTKISPKPIATHHFKPKALEKKGPRIKVRVESTMIAGTTMKLRSYSIRSKLCR